MLENSIEVNKSGIDALINSNGMTYIYEKSLLTDKQLEVIIFGRRWQSIRLKNLYSKTMFLTGIHPLIRVKNIFSALKSLFPF